MKNRMIVPGLLAHLILVAGFTTLSAQENYSTWSQHKNLILNNVLTSSSGGGVAGDVRNFPVLVRLDSANFGAGFAQSVGKGADLRFTRTGDAVRLPHQIESWDSAARTAAVWVLVDTVKGNAYTAVRMHWGKAGAADSSKGSAVFSPANGFEAVWHLAEAAAGDSARDATANDYRGAPSGSPGAVAGHIGGARGFNGTNQYFQVPNSASGSLNFAIDGFFTFSAWAYIDPTSSGTPEDNRVIVMKHDNQYALKLDLYGNWQFYEYDGTWQAVLSPYAESQWTHVTGVMNGRDTYLYVNGYEAAVLFDCCTGGGSRNEGTNVFIGRRGDQNSRWWRGMLDEVRIANTARSADWVRLEYENQKAGQTMAFLSDTVPVSLAGGPSRDVAKATLAFGRAAGTLRFKVHAPGAARVRLGLTDMRGRAVWTHEAATASGSMEAFWMGQENGQAAAAGVYALRATLLDAQGKALGTVDRKIPLTR